jgi:PadR family transcriptional regulator PadR
VSSKAAGTSVIDFPDRWWHIRVAYPQEHAMAPPESEVPYGTLDLMVLKTLAALGPLHGYGIARRIEQVANGSFLLNQGTIYPALLRLEQKGWIASAWGTSENNRRARFYSITAKGRRQLAAESALWARTVSIVNRLLEEDS